MNEQTGFVWDDKSGRYVRTEEAALPTKHPTQYVDVTVLIDESGSMGSMEEGVCDGVNEYVSKLRAGYISGECRNRWTLAFFDTPTKGEDFPRVMYADKAEGELPYLTTRDPILGTPNFSGKVLPGQTTAIPSGAPTVTYQPRGGTALVDAVCMSLQASRARTSGNEMAKRVMMIVTDGQENQSREYTTEKMRELVAEEQRLGHEFVFLAANFDAFAEARKYNAAAAGGSWMTQTLGGALVAPPDAVQSGASNAFNYAPTADGIKQAICSGFIGTQYISSGAMGSGKLGIAHTASTPL